MNTTKPAQAQVTIDGWTATVTHTGTHRDFRDGGMARNTWRWEVRSTTDAAEWQHVRSWGGTDLTSAMDVGDPDPIGALVSLGGFLGAYAESVEYGERTGRPGENADLFPDTLAANLAQDIADAIMLEFPEDES